MNTVTPVACSAAPRTNSYRWFAALALVGALAFSFALPGVASASEGGFRHNVLMRGQVLEKGDETLVVCVGQADVAQVGPVLDVIRHQRRIRHSRAGGTRYRRENVGHVRIAELLARPYAAATVLSTAATGHDTVE